MWLRVALVGCITFFLAGVTLLGDHVVKGRSSSDAARNGNSMSFSLKCPVTPERAWRETVATLPPVWPGFAPDTTSFTPEREL
jgi:hypothetical protein